MKERLKLHLYLLKTALLANNQFLERSK